MKSLTVSHAVTIFLLTIKGVLHLTQRVFVMGQENVFKTDFQVRFRDLDALSHVNNAVFFTYFEEGRKRFFDQHYNLDTRFDFPFILAHIRCDYLKPVTINIPITLCLWVGRIKHKSFEFEYRLVNQKDTDILYAMGQSVQVCFDYNLQQSMIMPKNLKKVLARYQKQ